MKQKVTLEQIQSLSPVGRKRLKQWFITKEIEPNLLTIGQLIEFIADQQDFGSEAVTNLMISKGESQWYLGTMGNPFIGVDGFSKDCPQLCDALWDVVFDILEGDNYLTKLI